MMDTQNKAMRDVFIDALRERMVVNDKIFFLSADFGSPALDRLKNQFSDRFINIGIAEQNLINVATGLALEGYTVYAYAIAPFITLRNYEQIRLQLSISSQIRPINVNLIGVGAGISYDMAGPTHHCLEDLTVMRLLPNMTVFSPSDWVLAEAFIDYTIANKSPKYLRFDSKSLPAIYKNISQIDIKKGFHEIEKGSDICLVSTGFLTHRALKTATKEKVGLIDIFVLKQLNEELFAEAIKKYKYLITIEEGFIGVGGLDSLVLKIINDKVLNVRVVKRMGFDDKYVFDLGSRDYLHRLNKIDEESIIKEIKIWKK